MTIVKATELGENINCKISEVFVDGFGHWLTYFSKDAEKLAAAFTHMFKAECFYAALIDGDVAGITACTDGKTPPIHLKKKELTRHLGFIRGRLAYIFLRRELENHPYPFEIKPGTGSIEFVATSSKYKGKGVATALINYIFAHTTYNEYVLEVADTNEPAVRLYSKIGFKEFTRVKQKHPKQSGINFLVYMKYIKNIS